MDKDKDRRDKTLEALATFIEQQKAILARTQSAITQLHKLKREAALVAPDVGELARQLSGSAFRLSEHAVEDWGGHAPDRVPQNIDWELFADKDPYPLQSLAHAARTAYAQRNTYTYTPPAPTSTSTAPISVSVPQHAHPPLQNPSPVSPLHRIQNLPVQQNSLFPLQIQNTPNLISHEEDDAALSPLQKLVRSAKKSILDPVLVPIQLSLQAEDAALAALEGGDVDVDMPASASSDTMGGRAHGLRSTNAAASCNGNANPKKNGKANGAARMPPRGRAGLFTRRPRAESSASAPVAVSAPPHSASPSVPLPHHDTTMGGDADGASATGSSTAVDSGSSASPPAFATPALPKTRARARTASVSSAVNMTSSPVNMASSHTQAPTDVPLALAKPIRARRISTKLAFAQEQGEGQQCGRSESAAATSPRATRGRTRSEAEAGRKEKEEAEAAKEKEGGAKEEKPRRRVILRVNGTPPAAALRAATPTPPQRRSSRAGRSVPAPISAPSPASTSAVDQREEEEEEEEEEENDDPTPDADEAAEDDGAQEQEQDEEPESKPVLGKRKREEKPRGDTYKVMWSASEQNQLERLLEEVPASDPRRYLKISIAMEGRRTPRQVSSRVQKYLQKLKRFGVAAPG